MFAELLELRLTIVAFEDFLLVLAFRTADDYSRLWRMLVALVFRTADDYVGWTIRTANDYSRLWRLFVDVTFRTTDDYSRLWILLADFSL